MQVELLSVTPNALQLIHAAFKQCYSKWYAGDIFTDGVHNKGVQYDKNVHGFIEGVLESGHHSPIEHVSFTFAIEGISRSLSHQLVRHRIASFSQQSQRYVNSGNFQHITPFSIQKNIQAKYIYDELMFSIQDTYDHLIELGIPQEDARYILPNAAETKIVVTMNCRSLWNFFNLRCCRRAQWEIREMANMMLEICKHEVEVVFDHAGPKCEQLKYCPEGAKFSCGKYSIK